MTPPKEIREKDTVLSRALAACRQQFIGVALFSGVVNVLQLTISLYMMQVFDRVLATRSTDTLLWLTVVAGSAILLLSGLSFLGLGTVPPTPEWGAMVSEGVQQFSAWWIAVYSGLAIFSVVVAFNIIGDSLRDALDPRSQKAVGGRAL